MVTFERWRPDEVDALVGFLTTEPWPFHAGTADPADLRERAADGYYAGPGTETYWIVDAGTRVGLVRLFDLDDGDPMFDLRLRAADRGRGLGTATVRWLTGHLFAARPGIHRVEATTRADNAAMRRALEKAGYTREARYREAWPVPGGGRLDAVGYAILQWEVQAGDNG